MRHWFWFGLLTLSIVSGAWAKEASVIKLPLPQMTGGKPLLQALKERHSTREFSGTPISRQLLSNLLWAADGVNRADSGKRTAPSARDWREIGIYVVMAEGAYRYDPTSHALHLVVARDLRALTGTQDFVASAQVNLVYVADSTRMTGSDAGNQTLYSAADTGFIASEGLGTVVRGSVDRETLATALGLAPHQQIILAQSVGYPMQ